MASPAPVRPGTNLTVAAAVAGLPLTNTHLEASFHDRAPLDLAAWLVPASFRPPSANHGHHLAQQSRRGQIEGTLRIAPKRLHAAMDTRVAPTAQWVADAVWLAVFLLVAAALGFAIKSAMF